MDIHPPHHPIRSVRDFLLQIFTVTVGIIIALGLEALLTWHNDRALAAVARADFVGELTDNLHSLDTVLPNDTAALAWMTATIAWGEARLQHRTLPKPQPPGSRSFATMSNAAWDTALATQAIHRLRFDEARKLSDAYSTQVTLNDFTSRAEQQWIAMSSFAGDPEALQDADARAALGQLKVAAAYAQTLASLEEKVMGEYKAALLELRKSQ
jgi:hypothetical protein